MKTFLLKAKKHICNWWIWNVKSNIHSAKYIARNWWKLHSIIIWYGKHGCMLSRATIKEHVTKVWLRPHDERITELEKKLKHLEARVKILTEDVLNS